MLRCVVVALLAAHAYAAGAVYDRYSPGSAVFCARQPCCMFIGDIKIDAASSVARHALADSISDQILTLFPAKQNTVATLLGQRTRPMARLRAGQTPVATFAVAHSSHRLTFAVPPR